MLSTFNALILVLRWLTFLPLSYAFTAQCSFIHWSKRNCRHVLNQKASAAPTTIESVTISDISSLVPPDWKQNNIWYNKAAAILKHHGVVALTPPIHITGGLISQTLCNNANEAALTRVHELHKRISSRGIDPSGNDQQYRFAEIVCRDEGGRRFDVPVPWLGGRNGICEEIGTPLTSIEREGITALHESIYEIVTPVLNSLWADSNKVDANDASYVAAAGFLMNQPGSNSQNWHRDGPDEGYIDCFVPLIDLNESVGPTAIQPGTHLSTTTENGEANENQVLIPLLNKGDILLFDYRTIHRGLGNISEDTIRTLAYAVFRRKEEGLSSDLGDIHNFPAALTLEYD